MFLLFQSLQ
ncbi:hypothetical protein LINPERPRIM_LOCUS4966 [Linum perenne]